MVKTSDDLLNEKTTIISDLLKNMEILKSEVEILKNENDELKQKFEDLISGELIIPQIDVRSTVIEIQELPDHKIEKIIIKYLKKNKNKINYPSDIAFTYNLDAKKVFEICQKLKKEGQLV